LIKNACFLRSAYKIANNKKGNLKRIDYLHCIKAYNAKPRWKSS
jgi:hypothetical protein